MKQSVNFYDFERAFRTMDRDNHFSYHGLRALFDYLEELGEDTGEEIELDVIALCCEFSEYTSALEAADNYSWDLGLDDDADEEEKETAAREWLNDETIVVDVDGGGIIIQDF